MLFLEYHARRKIQCDLNGSGRDKVEMQFSSCNLVYVVLSFLFTCVRIAYEFMPLTDFRGPEVAYMYICYLFGR